MSNGQQFGGPPAGMPGQPQQQAWGSQPSQPSQPVQPSQPQYAAQPGASILTQMGVENTIQLAKWMKIFAIINIVLGASYCLSLAGAIVGWLPILMGWWKLKASEELLRFAEASDTHALEESINHLRLYYLTVGILTLIGVGMMALMILGYILMVFVFGMAAFGAAAANS